MNFTHFHSEYKEKKNKNNLQTRLDHTKFNMGGTSNLENYHQSFGSWSIAHFNVSRSRLCSAQRSISTHFSWSVSEILTLCFCDNVLEQELLPDIRCSSNNNFPCQHHEAPAPPFMPHYRFLALLCARVHWTGKLAAKQSGSKSCGLFSVRVLQQMMLSQNFRQWPAELHAYWLLGQLSENTLAL